MPDHRPTPNRFKEAALEPGPPANYALVPQEYPPTTRETTDCMLSILWMVLLMCMASRLPCLLEKLFSGLKGRKA